MDKYQNIINEHFENQYHKYKGLFSKSGQRQHSFDEAMDLHDNYQDLASISLEEQRFFLFDF